jgi:ADP-heptose:LPS heptosyltransferase
VTADPVHDLPKDFVLLVNAKAEKGYDLILKVAALRPSIPFVAIASQTELEAAQEEAAGLENVVIVPQTSQIDALYRRARVVTVPSYKFVETFSRVCIEAHRFGKPVMGSDVGNVPNLLAESGVVLPEDAGLWAAELDRLYGDETYYEQRSAAALENSNRYTYDQQRAGILAVVGAADHPMLVGIGSGIGNMIHVGPMIRRIAEHLGRRVDLVVAEDHGDSLFLLHNPEWVNSVFSLRQVALSRRYDTVFLTHSFGSARVPFRAREVIWSRDWDTFRPDHPLHETLFNLEAAKQLLGVEYKEADAHNSFVGDIGYVWPGGNLVGVHGGSKEGFWVSKRWPYYSELAAELTRRGYRVASFGTAEEYVEGTEDMTGGTIREMARQMRACSYFVSNDSGVMNLANALGIPLVSIFAPTNASTRGPLRPTSRVVALEKACSPCECKAKELFLSGGCRCIGDISLQEVVSAFETLADEVRQAGAKGATKQRVEREA